MKIKKMYQGNVPGNKVLNAYSDSQTDVYSCDYMNNLKTSMMTAYMGSNYSYTTTTHTHTKLPLSGTVSIGDKFTLSNNEIVIGNDVSVVKINANISTAWNGTAQGDLLLYLHKNGDLVCRVSGNKYDVNMSEGISLSPVLLKVSPGDRLSLALYTNNAGSINVLGGDRPIITYMTVQTVEEKTSIAQVKTESVELINGLETATNEYINGKRVYTKFIEAGAMSNNYMYITHGVTGYDKLWVDIANTWGVAPDGVIIPIPFHNAHNANYSIEIVVNGNTVQLYSPNQRIANTYVTLKYTKN